MSISLHACEKCENAAILFIERLLFNAGKFLVLGTRKNKGVTKEWTLPNIYFFVKTNKQKISAKKGQNGNEDYRFDVPGDVWEFNINWTCETLTFDIPSDATLSEVLFVFEIVTITIFAFTLLTVSFSIWIFFCCLRHY